MTLSPLVVLLDQGSKFWILKNLPLGQSFTVIKNFFEIAHIKNRGAAFGMLAQWNSVGREWFFYLISGLAMVALFVIYAQTRPDQRRMHIPLALIFGGAIGNLIDRLWHGEVTDFLVFHWHNKIADFWLVGKHFRFALSWPAFNVADAAISCGAIYLVLIVLFFDKKKI